MKHKNQLLIFITCIFLFGCTSFHGINREITVTGFDFTKYTKEGFLITPLTYDGEYESCGLVTATLFGEIKESNQPERGYKQILVDTKTFQVENINPYEAIDKMYEVAKKMGANAIVNFNSTTIYKTVKGMTIPGFEVSGFAIKKIMQ